MSAMGVREVVVRNAGHTWYSKFSLFLLLARSSSRADAQQHSLSSPLMLCCNLQTAYVDMHVYETIDKLVDMMEILGLKSSLQITEMHEAAGISVKVLFGCSSKRPYWSSCQKSSRKLVDIQGADIGISVLLCFCYLGKQAFSLAMK